MFHEAEGYPMKLFSRVVQGAGSSVSPPVEPDAADLRTDLATTEADLTTARANLRDALARRDETSARLHEERIVAVDARRVELVGLLAAAQARETATATALTERAVAQQQADAGARLDAIEARLRTYTVATLRRAAAIGRAQRAVLAARRFPMPASMDEAGDWMLILEKAGRPVADLDLDRDPDELERAAAELESA